MQDFVKDLLSRKFFASVGNKPVATASIKHHHRTERARHGTHGCARGTIGYSLDRLGQRTCTGCIGWPADLPVTVQPLPLTPPWPKYRRAEPFRSGRPPFWQHPDIPLLAGEPALGPDLGCCHSQSLSRCPPTGRTRHLHDLPWSQGRPAARRSDRVSGNVALKRAPCRPPAIGSCGDACSRSLAGLPWLAPRSG
jgi:hypothetical protein